MTDFGRHTGGEGSHRTRPRCVEEGVSKVLGPTLLDSPGCRVPLVAVGSVGQGWVQGSSGPVDGRPSSFRYRDVPHSSRRVTWTPPGPEEGVTRPLVVRGVPTVSVGLRRSFVL